MPNGPPFFEFLTLIFEEYSLAPLLDYNHLVTVLYAARLFILVLYSNRILIILILLLLLSDQDAFPLIVWPQLILEYYIKNHIQTPCINRVRYLCSIDYRFKQAT